MRPSNIGDIIARLPDAKQRGVGWTASCPCPGHQTPSGHLSVRDEGDRALVHCHGPHTYEDICRSLGFESLTYSGNDTETTQVWAISDLNGRVVAEHVRTDRPEGGKRYAWRRNGARNLGGLKVPALPLYGVDRLAGLANDRPVVIVEGEKAADALSNFGVLALGTVTGASSTPGVESLRPIAEQPQTVHLWPDNDEAGRKHMTRVAATLYRLGKHSRIVNWQGAPEKGDAADWLAAGGTGDDLQKLLQEAHEWEPSQSDSDTRAVRLRCMADVEAEEVSWLWYPYIPSGKVTMVEGDPAVGKSWACLAIATAVTLGQGLPGQEAREPASVVIATAEDGLADTIRPRLDSMCADASRVFAIEGPLTLDDKGFDELKRRVLEVRPALVVIDPLVAYIGASVDIHRANETRAVLSRLAGIAEKEGVAILAVRHLNKSSGGKALYRGSGSIDFAAACRSVLLAGYAPDDPQRRAIVQIKNNLALEGPTIGYEVPDGNFRWTGTSDLTKEQILAVSTGEETTALSVARTFLRDELADGPVAAARVIEEARSLGIAKRTLDRAKAQLRVVVTKQGESGKRGGGRWLWMLPEGHTDGEDDLGRQDCHTRESGNLNHSSFGNGSGKTDIGSLNPSDASDLGMTDDEALELWRRAGKPVITLGPGETCYNLEGILANPDRHLRHVEAVRAWLENLTAE